MKKVSEAEHPILLFDGHCNFCNSWVDFILRKDKKRKFRLAALQSESGMALRKKYNIDLEEDSAVLIYLDKVYKRSSAGLHVLYHMGGWRSVFFAFILVPSFIRDFYYDLIARNRYKLWGRREVCRTPSEAEKELFL